MQSIKLQPLINLMLLQGIHSTNIDHAILPFHWNGIACLFTRAANEIVNFSTSEHYEDVIKNSEC